MRALSVFLVLTLATIAAADAPDAPKSFTPEQIQQFEDQRETMVQEREKAAFERGQIDQRVRCPALI
jgi:hypothetical protein